MDDLQTIEQQFNALFSLVENDHTFSALDQTVSLWSVGDHVAHVALALDRMGRSVGKTLRPETSTDSTGPNKLGVFILNSGAIPRGKAQAPEFVHPNGVSSREDVKAELEQAHLSWEKLTGRENEIESSDAVVQHHLLGDFTAVNWTRFACIHTEHHLKIILDILEATGIPAPEQIEIIRTKPLG
ncbi:MAG: hypothetical protein BMS9Abin05_1557 [Rhodothermia bacterium]|nr:MAG: hypothetical protein BMS9Abin05_1557 [Rhodothermia bacterium]